MDGEDITWRGLVLVPTRSATQELYDLKMTIHDVKNVLEEGYDCSRGKRKQGTYEKCRDKGRKTIKVVVCESYGIFSKRREWAIIHVGIFTKRK